MLASETQRGVCDDHMASVLFVYCSVLPYNHKLLSERITQASWYACVNMLLPLLIKVQLFDYLWTSFIYLSFKGLVRQFVLWFIVQMV